MKEDKIEVGEYVRTNDGYIAKYIGKNKTQYCVGGHLSFDSQIRDCDELESGENTCIWESELDNKVKIIVKHSKNIIDLIEVGDYVNGEEITYLKYDLFINSDYKENYAKNIKSIVTKEQFKSIEYRLED